MVLADIRDAQGEVFQERKGTTFRGRATLWVGRACATDDYLNARDRHWANLSIAQHREVMSEARLESICVKYLFITALMNQSTIHYWMVPGDVIDRIAFAAHQDDPDFVYALHIRENAELFEIEGEDVTRFHRVLELSPAESNRLDAEFKTAKRARELRASKRFVTARNDFAANREKSSFQIPLNGGRSAVLSVPLPAADTDLQRIKGWIDLMSDVLTEPISSAGSSPDESVAADAAITTLQRQAAAAGNDQLSDEDIAAEIRGARRERRR